MRRVRCWPRGRRGHSSANGGRRTTVARTIVAVGSWRSFDEPMDPASLPAVALRGEGPPDARLQGCELALGRGADGAAAARAAAHPGRLPAHSGAAAWCRLLLRHAADGRSARRRDTGATAVYPAVAGAVDADRQLG